MEAKFSAGSEMQLQIDALDGSGATMERQAVGF
jgi:hypothetical protein